MPAAPQLLPPLKTGSWIFPALMIFVFAAYITWDLRDTHAEILDDAFRELELHAEYGDARVSAALRRIDQVMESVAEIQSSMGEIGRASCRERV